MPASMIGAGGGGDRHLARRDRHEPVDAGDAVFAVLCACGQCLRMVLAHLRALLAMLLTALVTVL